MKKPKSIITSSYLPENHEYIKEMEGYIKYLENELKKFASPEEDSKMYAGKRIIEIKIFLDDDSLYENHLKRILALADFIGEMCKSKIKIKPQS